MAAAQADVAAEVHQPLSKKSPSSSMVSHLSQVSHSPGEVSGSSGLGWVWFRSPTGAEQGGGASFDTQNDSAPRLC